MTDKPKQAAMFSTKDGKNNMMWRYKIFYEGTQTIYYVSACTEAEAMFKCSLVGKEVTLISRKMQEVSPIQTRSSIHTKG